MGMMRSALGFLGLAGESDPSPISSSDGFLGRRAAREEPLSGRAMGAGLAFRGELTGEGDFEILGRFEGEINVSGRVIVSPGAEVDANINAAAIVVGGTVRGNLSATTRVEILPSGVLTGTLRTGSFAAADGANVKGEVWIERAARPAVAGASHG
jgi:cytoskeletal protein CcmA (bactofilin family)